MVFTSTTRRRLAGWVLLPLLVVLAAVSLVTLAETNAWWVRFLDYPRVQFLVAIGVVAILYLLVRPRSKAIGTAALVAAIAGASYHVYKLHPYTALVEPMAVSLDACPAEASIRILSANVQRRNENAAEFIRLVEEADPDLVLVLETDAWWDTALAPLGARYPQAYQSIPEEAEFFGMHVFSRLPVDEPEFLFLFGRDTPTFSGVVRASDGSSFRFFGLHPRPPLYWSQPTTMRDAHILSVANMARAETDPVVVAGDLNAVPWERVTRRAMRIGGLLDPRVGRGIMPTYDVDTPLVTWPLDQILHTETIALQGFDVPPAFGSDHRPVLAELCLDERAAALQSAPAATDDDLAEAETSIAAARELADRDP